MKIFSTSKTYNAFIPKILPYNSLNVKMSKKRSFLLYNQKMSGNKKERRYHSFQKNHFESFIIFLDNILLLLFYYGKLINNKFV